MFQKFNHLNNAKIGERYMVGGQEFLCISTKHEADIDVEIRKYLDNFCRIHENKSNSSFNAVFIQTSSKTGKLIKLDLGFSKYECWYGNITLVDSEANEEKLQWRWH